MHKKKGFTSTVLALIFIISSTVLAGEEITKEYYRDGKLKAECHYNEGKLEGVSRRYDEDGNLREEHYKNNVQEGLTRHYYGNTNEKKKREIMFKNGKPNGPYKDYYENGVLMTDGFRSDGKYEGMCKTYDQEGRLRVEKSYKNGRQEGPAKLFYETGELEKELRFSRGKLDGPARFYYKSGKIKEDLVYSSGRVTERRCFTEEEKPRACPAQ